MIQDSHLMHGMYNDNDGNIYNMIRQLFAFPCRGGVKPLGQQSGHYNIPSGVGCMCLNWGGGTGAGWNGLGRLQGRHWCQTKTYITEQQSWCVVALLRSVSSERSLAQSKVGAIVAKTSLDQLLYSTSVQSWKKSMELFAAPINLSKGPFISTRPNRLGEPPLVSLLSWSRGGLRNGCRVQTLSKAWRRRKAVGGKG